MTITERIEVNPRGHAWKARHSRDTDSRRTPAPQTERGRVRSGSLERVPAPDATFMRRFGTPPTRGDSPYTGVIVAKLEAGRLLEIAAINGRVEEHEYAE